jgi:ubiquinone/menaquinone biosynthesis C-methylase UbiE
MDYREIYEHHPDRYDALVSAEDAAGELPAKLAELTPLEGKRVVEAGAGTGRVSRLLLAAGAKRVIATDRALPMLRFAGQRLAQARGAALQLAVADAAALPLANDCGDVALAGWVFGHLRSWLADRWQSAIGAALDELARCVPGGPSIVIETLGTAVEVAGAPSPALADYYRFLEQTRGFQRHTIRTDYRFRSPQEAAEICGFFFGDELGARVARANSAVVPEFTGVWICAGDDKRC